MLDKIEFLTKNENKFYDFINNLNKKDKIALISHVDLDGLSSAKIVNEFIKPKILKFLNYEELNDKLVKELKRSKINKVIFTDLNPSSLFIVKSIEKFAKILIIDHHLFKNNLNSNNTILINAQGYCTSYLVYYLGLRIKDLSKFDWLVACASISDWQFFNNKGFMSKIYEKYGDKFYSDENEIKKGFFWELQNNLSLSLIYFRGNLSKIYKLITYRLNDVTELDRYAIIVKKEVDKHISDFNKNKIEFKDGYFYELKSKLMIKDVVINSLSLNKINKTVIVAQRKEKYSILEVRRYDNKVNMAEFLTNLTKGLSLSVGGHFIAAGAVILNKDLNKLKEKLIKLK